MRGDELAGVSLQNPCKWKISDHRWKLAVSTRQWGTMLQSGMNIMDALETLSRQVDDRKFQLVLAFVSGKVYAGHRLSQTLACFPQIFSTGFVGLVRSGEISGQLPENLLRLADMLERESQLVRRVTSAMTYPCFVLLTTAVLTVALFSTVLPNFVSIFEDMKIPLPLLTQVLVGLTRACRNPGYWLLAAGLVSQVILAVRSLQSTPQGRAWLERKLRAIPWFGPALHFSFLARYCLTLENLLNSGLALGPALKLAGEASGSTLLEQDAAAAVGSLEQGRPLAAHYRAREDLYTRMTANLVEMGEETSALGPVLKSLGDWYSEETENRLSVAQAAMEPAMMAFVSVMVGSVVVGIFLPLYSYLGQLGA